MTTLMQWKNFFTIFLPQTTFGLFRLNYLLGMFKQFHYLFGIFHLLVVQFQVCIIADKGSEWGIYFTHYYENNDIPAV